MPYKPTGKPPGRPRKKPVAEPAKAAPFAMASLKRARAGFRQAADAVNPHPAVTVRDGRGRPRAHKSSNHAWIGTCRP